MILDFRIVKKISKRFFLSLILCLLCQELYAQAKIDTLVRLDSSLCSAFIYNRVPTDFIINLYPIIQFYKDSTFLFELQDINFSLCIRGNWSQKQGINALYLKENDRKILCTESDKDNFNDRASLLSLELAILWHRKLDGVFLIGNGKNMKPISGRFKNLAFDYIPEIQCNKKSYRLKFTSIFKYDTLVIKDYNRASYKPAISFVEKKYNIKVTNVSLIRNALNKFLLGHQKMETYRLDFMRCLAKYSMNRFNTERKLCGCDF